MDVVELPRRLTEEERDELFAGEDDPFEMAALTMPPDRRKDRYIVVRDHGRLIAAVGLLVADVEVGSAAFPVVGFGGVIVSHTHRGRGVFRRAMEPALATAERLGPDFAVLFCLRKNAPLYARLGFATIDAPVTAAGVAMPIDSMWRPLEPHAQWPAGPVTVPGPMF
ncbi:GNAT family N-acetyltransferase [Solirubrobacter phytolaccae]|uniref:GNAT family N-acetyltransferase n=1 Tax=Solirubrobacter phytolaccae TaxID=1404360 RepID=A0A9X3NGH3_9ACTN|nr:GNAT family N-acetyltransferase [Solirubrobacter phytolaccae]MDA0183611.1 GNAT family N-acetyltransferase [Solirubrobacter phytolaccae]